VRSTVLLLYKSISVKVPAIMLTSPSKESSNQRKDEQLILKCYGTSLQILRGDCPALFRYLISIKCPVELESLGGCCM